MQTLSNHPMQRLAGMTAALLISLIGLASSGLALGADKVWVPTGSLNMARVGHTATLLQDGKVLVTGGTGDGSTEIYETATGIWSMTGSFKQPRNGHTVTLLQGGKVLAVGGDTGGPPPDFGRTESAELYDPATGTWGLTGSRGTIRYGHTATLLQNGKVLVAGGFNSHAPLDSAELYDPLDGTWRLTGRLGVARYGHTATILPDGKVLIARGSNDGDLGSTLHDAELYDPISNTWSYVGSLGPNSVGHSATLLPNGNVLVAGGYQPGWSNGDGTGFAVANSLSNAEAYDPGPSTVTHTGSMSTIRSYHTATLLPNGEVLVVGGAAWRGRYPHIQVETLGSTELYDEGSGRWSSARSLALGRSHHTATLLADGRVLVAGGETAGLNGTQIALAKAELYSIMPPGTIGAGFTGSWFNPAQNGHGFALEVLPGQPQQLLASWFTFAPQGGPSWIVGLGPINGNQAVLQGSQSVGSGGRFPPNFDAANVRQQNWGTLTFSFSDCNHGHVDWVSSVPGYTSGGMDLTRLTLPAELTCSNVDSGAGAWDY